MPHCVELYARQARFLREVLKQSGIIPRRERCPDPARHYRPLHRYLQLGVKRRNHNAIPLRVFYAKGFQRISSQYRIQVGSCSSFSFSFTTVCVFPATLTLLGIPFAWVTYTCPTQRPLFRLNIVPSPLPLRLILLLQRGYIFVDGARAD